MALEVIKVQGKKQKQTGEELIEFLVPVHGVCSLIELGGGRYSVQVKPEYLTGLGNIKSIEATIANVEIL